MRIVEILSDCISTMTAIKQFINEPRSQGNVLLDNSENPFVLLDRPIDMPFTYKANFVGEVYEFTLIYGVISDNTKFSNSQNGNDVEISQMVDQARIMILNLSKHPQVRSVEIISPMKDYINGFDVNAAGVFQFLRVVLLPKEPDVCSTL